MPRKEAPRRACTPPSYTREHVILFSPYTHTPSFSTSTSAQKHLEAAPWTDAVALLTEVLRFVGQALELARGATERDLLAVLLAGTAGFRPIQDRYTACGG